MNDPTRFASPVPAPQGLAWHDGTMWMTSASNGRVYAVERESWTIVREFTPPAEALGITFTGADFRLVLAPGIDEPELDADHRYVYSFAPDAGFAECFECPDGSGSHLAYANGALYVSQAWDKKIVELDAEGRSVREIGLARRPVGMTVVDGSFYLATVDDDWNEGRLERLGVAAEPSAPCDEVTAFSFKPRGVAFDGEYLWTADRNNDAIVRVRLDRRNVAASRVR